MPYQTGIRLLCVAQNPANGFPARLLDPEIIAWCRNNGAAWVHADDRARRAHQALLQTSGIRTLLVSRERGRMSAKEQLRILSVVLPKLLENWQRRPATRHYRATAVSQQFQRPR